MDWATPGILTQTRRRLDEPLKVRDHARTWAVPAIRESFQLGARLCNRPEVISGIKGDSPQSSAFSDGAPPSRSGPRICSA